MPIRISHVCSSTNYSNNKKSPKKSPRFLFDDFISNCNTLLPRINASMMFQCRLRKTATGVYTAKYSSNVPFINGMFGTEDNINHLGKNDVELPKFSRICHGKSLFKYINSHVIQRDENINCFSKLITTWTFLSI